MLWTEKRWHFAAVTGDEGIVAAAVANLGYMGLGFAYAFDRATGQHRRFEAMTPLALGALVMEEPDSGFSRLSLPTGLIRLDAGTGRLEVRTAAFEADLDVAPAAPFDAGWHIPAAGDHRTRKRMGGRGSGVVRWDGRQWDLAGGVLEDWSRGELARETSWRWAAGTGRVGEHVIAWNLRTGFDDPTQAENAVWLAGLPEPVGAATIEPGPADSPWRIEAGPLTLVFEPDGEHQENLDFGLVASRYRQPWGRFHGTWGDSPVEATGVVEDHWARW